MSAFKYNIIYITLIKNNCNYRKKAFKKHRPMTGSTSFEMTNGLQ